MNTREYTAQEKQELMHNVIMPMFDNPDNFKEFLLKQERNHERIAYRS